MVTFIDLFRFSKATCISTCRSCGDSRRSWLGSSGFTLNAGLPAASA